MERRKYFPNSDLVNNQAWTETNKATPFGNTEPDATSYTTTNLNNVSSDDGGLTVVSAITSSPNCGGHRIKLRITENVSDLIKFVVTLKWAYIGSVSSGNGTFSIEIFNNTTSTWEVFDSGSWNGGNTFQIQI